jgi:hypothetical protein
MRKLSLALNDVVSRYAKETRLEHTEVCLAALGLLTAHLERVRPPEKRRALAACFSEMFIASCECAAPRRLATRSRTRQRLGAYLFRRSTPKG